MNISSTTASIVPGQAKFERVKALQSAGKSLRAIAQETGLNGRTVAKWAQSDALPLRNRMAPKPGLLGLGSVTVTALGRRVHHAAGCFYWRSNVTAIRVAVRTLSAFSPGGELPTRAVQSCH